jgi:hypothetical protein
MFSGEDVARRWKFSRVTLGAQSRIIEFFLQNSAFYCAASIRALARNPRIELSFIVSRGSRGIAPA